jgi:hypothetical protein
MTARCTGAAESSHSRTSARQQAAAAARDLRSGERTPQSSPQRTIRGVTPLASLFARAGEVEEARNVWTGPAGRYCTNALGDVVNSSSQPNASWHEILPEPRSHGAPRRWSSASTREKLDLINSLRGQTYVRWRTESVALSA